MIRRIGGIATILLSGFAFSYVQAGVVYDTGTLHFESSGQSMWGTGAAFRKEESAFVGTQWYNKTATIGGVVGSEHDVVIPGTDPVYTSIWEPRIWVPTPSWSSPLAGYWTGCGCTKSVKIWPGTSAVTADTRTGAKLDVHTSGKVGLEFGYSIDSGSVDTIANFGAMATLPDVVNAAEFFSVSTSNLFSSGAIATQSPKVEAYISAIMELSGSVDAQACALTFGCKTGSFDMPSINLDQRILSVDPGSLKILDGVLPSGEALAEVPILNQGLTLEGGISATPPAVGFKLTGPYGASLVNTLPSPSVTVDLAEVTVNVPDIATSGTGAGVKVTSSGRDDFLSAQLDIDGAATMFAGLPPAGLNFDLIDIGVFKVGASLDLIDVDAGPVVGITQDFEFVPTLMVDLAFNNPVQIDGFANPQTSWTGLWDALPDFAIFGETTFTPTFWLEAMLRNDLGIDLGLVGTLDVLKFGATASVGPVDLLNFNPISLNHLLGLSNELFRTPTVGFSVYDNMFALGGFNTVAGQPFTLRIGQPPVVGGDNGQTIPPGGVTGQVPGPGSFWLLMLGLLAVFKRPNRLAGGHASYCRA